MISFNESGMAFRFPEKQSFYIEKCGLYHSLNGKGISSVECITMKQKKGSPLIFFIEAKTSAPKPLLGKPRPEEGTEQKPLDMYVKRITKKFTDSLSLCCALLTGTQQVDAADPYGIGTDLDKALRYAPQIRFVLIIQEQKKEWLSDIRDVLKKNMNHVLRIWKADLVVLNEDMARKYGFIL